MSILKDRVRGIVLSVAHLVGSRRRQRCVVLVYHRIVPMPPLNDPWTVSVREFERHMEVLAAEGFRDVALQELESDPQRPSGRTVLIAFDDGYSSAVEFALPVLRTSGRRAAFFLVAGALGGASEWERTFDLKPSAIMSWVDAQRLVRDGMSIGSHSMTHADLQLSDEISIELEISHSKQALERELGIDVRSFGVPFGRDDGRLDPHLIRAGYVSKFTNPLAARRTRLLKAFPVVGIVQGESLRSFRYHLSGAYEVLHLYHRLRASLHIGR